MLDITINQNTLHYNIFVIFVASDSQTALTKKVGSPHSLDEPFCGLTKNYVKAIQKSYTGLTF